MISGPIYVDPAYIRANICGTGANICGTGANICGSGRHTGQYMWIRMISGPIYVDPVDIRANSACICAKTELWQPPGMRNRIIWQLGATSEYSANIFGWGGFSQLQFGSDSVELYGRSNEYYGCIIRSSSTCGAR